MERQIDKSTSKRVEGACSGCARAKQKCDHKQPQCSRCDRNGLVCVLQTFKPVELPEDGTRPLRAQFSCRKRNLERDNRHLVSYDAPPGRPSSRPLRRPTAQAHPNLDAPERTYETDEDIDGSHAIDTQDNRASFRAKSPSLRTILRRQSGLTDYGSDYASEALAQPPSFSCFQPFSTRGPASPGVIVASPALQVQTDVHFLWQHFVQHTSKGFLIWDSNIWLGDKAAEDPYATGLPDMATASLALYYAALALSAFHYNGSTGDNSLCELQTTYERKAIQALAENPSNAAQSPEHYLHTVTCIMLLCTSSPGVYADLLPLARSAAACLLNERSLITLNPDQLSVAMMLVRWCEVCVLCSFRSTTRLSEKSIHSLLEDMADDEEVKNPTTFKNWIIHPLYGFSRHLIRPLLKMARLTRDLQNAETWPTRLFSLEAETVELEAQLLEAREDDTKATGACPIRHNCLLHLNEAIHSSAIIIFYTRLRDLHWTNYLIRTHVETVCSELSYLDRHSRISLAIIFPCFVAGCEAVDATARQRILSLLDDLKGNWLGRTSRMAQCLQHVWAIRDQDPGATWMTWNKKVSPQFADCIPC